MKKLLFALFLLVQVGVASAQHLQFNSNGKFKIVQFTDVHYIHKDARAKIALERIREVLDEEKPDFVVFTGDVIFGKPAKKSILDVLTIVSDQQIPFAVVWGNHDLENGLNGEELFNVIKDLPGNLTSITPGLSGTTNFILPVKSSDGKENREILYFFDSHSGCSLKDVGGYAYIRFDQINWYRENSQKFTESNQGKPIPSLAFFHIPLPEFHQACQDESTAFYGFRKEKACSPKLNSGLFTSMKEQGDVEGVFVGHDHDNDYAVLWHGILLAYGRYSGGNTVYNDLENGARVIELTEGEKGFRSWIRLSDNRILQQVKYPESFLRLYKD